MNLVLSFRRSLALGAVFSALAATSSAQIADKTNLSMTNWVHAHGSPYWTDNLTYPQSQYGRVDRLNHISWFEYVPRTFTLQPGTYRARVWFSKLSGGRAYPLRLSATVDSRTTTATTAVSAQPVGRFVGTKALVFDVTKPNSRVSIRFHNTDTKPVIMGPYLFDTFAMTRIAGGDIVRAESVSGWTPTHAAYYASVDSGISGYDQIKRLGNRNGLTWHNLASSASSLSPGAYKARVRFRKTVHTTGRSDMNLKVTALAPASGSVTSKSLAANQAVGQWVDLDLRFTVRGTIRVKFDLFEHARLNMNYEFAEFTLFQEGSFESRGVGCRGTRGTVTLAASTIPRIGRRLSTTMRNLRPNSQAVMYLGVSDSQWGSIRLPLELSFIGAPGCRQYVNPEYQVGFSTGNGSPTWGFTAPNDVTLLGKEFFMQAAILDLNANALNIVTTNYLRGVWGS